MVQNAKFPPCGVVRRQLNLWLAPEFLGHFEAGDEPTHLGFCNPSQALQITQLSFKMVVSTVEPVPLPGGPMDAQRPANAIAKFVRLKLILAWKHLNPFGETRASLHRHLKAKGEIVDVDAAVSSQQ